VVGLKPRHSPRPAASPPPMRSSGSRRCGPPSPRSCRLIRARQPDPSSQAGWSRQWEWRWPVRSWNRNGGHGGSLGSCCMQPSSPGRAPVRYPGFPRTRPRRPQGAAGSGQGRARADPDTPAPGADEDLSHDNFRGHHPDPDSGRPRRPATAPPRLPGAAADYLAIDVTLIRVGFVVLTFLGGAAIPAYLACLLLIPEEGSDQSIAASLLDSVRLSRPDRNHAH
jgi:hypothetical protein